MLIEFATLRSHAGEFKCRRQFSSQDHRIYRIFYLARLFFSRYYFYSACIDDKFDPSHLTLRVSRLDPVRRRYYVIGQE